MARGTSSPVAGSWSQTEVRVVPRMAAESSTTRPRISSRPWALASSRPNSSSAFALSASRRSASYRRAFSSATEAWPAAVALAELVEAEFGDPEHADDARAVAERDVDLRLLDHVRAGHLPRVGVVCRVADEQRLPRLGAVARDALPDLARQDVDGRLRARREVAAEGDRDDEVAVDDEDAAVVVVDQRPELVRDHHPDLAHVVQPVELAAQALEHLQVRDRADVARLRRALGALRRPAAE